MTKLTSDPDEYVTVGEFIEPIDAQMAKSVLESAGIESFLLSENTNSLLGAAFFAQLQVHKKDEGDALKILDVSGDDSGADSNDLSGAGERVDGEE